MIIHLNSVTIVSCLASAILIPGIWKIVRDRRNRRAANAHIWDSLIEMLGRVNGACLRNEVLKKFLRQRKKFPVTNLETVNKVRDAYHEGIENHILNCWEKYAPVLMRCCIDFNKELKIKK
jgi:hypothetical protein